MGQQTTSSYLPSIASLADQDAIERQFNELIQRIDEEEYGLTEGMDFPDEDLNYFGIMSWEEVNFQDIETLYEFSWRIIEVVRRIDIRRNRIDKILYWLNDKIYKAISMMPPNVLAYDTYDVKVHKLANKYPAFKLLLVEKNDYERLKLHWKNTAEALDKKERIITRLTTRKENQNVPTS